MRVLLRLIVVLLLGGAAPSNAQTPQAEAPLGLMWGMSSAEVAAKAVELKPFDGSDFGKSFVAVKLERALADQEVTLLSFGHNDKLWRIVINGRSVENDLSGSSILPRYRELSGVLTEKYGKPREIHEMGDSIYADQKYFAAGIKMGQTRWFSNFETPGLLVQLGIRASCHSACNIDPLSRGIGVQN
jgi:hypothetical protein